MKNSLIIFLLFFVIVSSCKEPEIFEEDHFFVANDGAVMPVYIRGNLSAEAIVLFLHGGPGGNASQATFIPSFQEIEGSYAIAYWDQRASGLSQGNPEKSTFTVNQFVEDTYFVIQALKQRFRNKKIFLLGHSWGGALGAAFLSTENHQSEVAGFICMNSGHNLEKGLPLSVDWIESFAKEQIDAGVKTEYWNEVVTWSAGNPDMTEPDNYFKYVDYLRETDAYRYENQEVKIDPVTMGDILNSRLSLAILVGGRNVSRNFNILKLNLSKKMNSITIPSLVLWGRHDGVNTLEMGYDAFNSLGTEPTDKEMIILENSAHEGYVEEPEIFSSSVLLFIDKYL